MDKVYVGQIGVVLEVETQGTTLPAVNWADATTLEIICRRPDLTEVAFTASMTGTKLTYTTTTALELPMAGRYAIQAHVVGPGYDALGETDNFNVYLPWK